MAPAGAGGFIRVRKAIRFVAFVAFALLAFAPAGGASPGKTASEEASVRVFVLRYKRVEEAALLIRPHLSDSASVTLTQKLNAMTITDRDENLKTIAKVVAEFDVPPRGFTFAVKLVRARAEQGDHMSARLALREVHADVRGAGQLEPGDAAESG